MHYLVKKYQEVLATKGLVEQSDQCIGRTIPEEVKQAVFSFYNDEYTRAMPGKKDFVSEKYRHS